MPEPYRPRKLFTVEEANNCLPLVKAIVADVVATSAELVDRRQRLDHLTDGREPEPGDVYGDELADIGQELARDEERLKEYLQELHELGVELKSPMDGLIDFPSVMDDRVVYLCWKHGEPEVLYWHELDAGFQGRQSLTAGAIDSPGDGAEGGSEV
ncbi:MAG: DUF2203 domain-containing protein [Pirellulaceae bacterium]|jgi:hypothetical protein|nr:DUF2203 domain-containing protein [Pirellulaceae bacterium]MDP7014467.1 DUF2203 domain-containing protein [Pirellulaceae bacterium]